MRKCTRKFVLGVACLSAPLTAQTWVASQQILRSNSARLAVGEVPAMSPILQPEAAFLPPTTGSSYPGHPYCLWKFNPNARHWRSTGRSSKPKSASFWTAYSYLVFQLPCASWKDCKMPLPSTDPSSTPSESNGDLTVKISSTTSRREKLEHALQDAPAQDILLFLVAFRILNALALSTFFQPDEYFQSLEPAWQIAFGDNSGAWITWVSMRSDRRAS